jgi:fucose permease
MAAFHWLRPELAWRVMFWIGIMPALLVLYIRRRVREPEIFAEQARRGDEERSKFSDIFSAPLLRTTVLASVVVAGMQGGYYAITIWLPTLLQRQGFSVPSTGSYMFMVIGGSFVGYLVSAHVADYLGRRITIISFAACACGTLVLYSFLPLQHASIFLLGFPLGFSVSGTFSPIGAVLTELFPTRVRGSGQGFCYNVGRAVGAGCPAVVGFVSATMTLGKAVAIVAVCAYALMVVTLAILPETKGKKLEA